MNAKEQIARRQAQIEEAQAEIIFLSRLPDGLDIESCLPCGGEWLLNINGDANEAIHLLPPLAIEIRADNYGEPVASFQERLATNGDICFPVWTNSSGKTTWWSCLDSGERVKVGLSGKQSSQNVVFPQVPEGYVCLKAHHATFYKRKRAVAQYERVTRPAEENSRKWNEFYQVAGYRENQKQLARVLQAAANHDQHVEMSDLPAMPAETLSVAGAELVILRSGSTHSTGEPYKGPFPALPRIGNFWRAFTLKQAEELVAFANTMVVPLETRDERFCRQLLEVAREAASEFVSLFLTAQRNKPDTSVIAEWVSARVGYPVSITLRDRRNCSTEPQGIRYICWVAVDKWMEDWSFTVPAVFDLQGFDWEYPSTTEYEPCGPLFVAQAVSG